MKKLRPVQKMPLDRRKADHRDEIAAIDEHCRKQGHARERAAIWIGVSRRRGALVEIVFGEVMVRL